VAQGGVCFAKTLFHFEVYYFVPHSFYLFQVHVELTSFGTRLIKTWRINIDAYNRFRIKLNRLSEELVLSLDVLSKL
jgi:hypothetical protein